MRTRAWREGKISGSLNLSAGPGMGWGLCDNPQREWDRNPKKGVRHLERGGQKPKDRRKKDPERGRPRPIESKIETRGWGMETHRRGTET